MLFVENISKSFGENKAVDNLSFSIERPGIFGLIGTNGAGKTTGIRCILGIMKKDTGISTWKGKEINRIHKDFGYMPEERGLYMKTNVLEQLIYFGSLRGMERQEAKKSALTYMERLDVLQYKGMTAEKLSKGNQQKIQLIATLVHQPKLIFLDEPFSGLDPVNTNVLRALMEELVKEGRMIVMSSHQMSVVEDYCEDIVLLNKGQSILQGNLKEIKESYGLRNLLIEGDEKIKTIGVERGLEYVKKHNGYHEFLIDGREEGQNFIASLVTQGIIPTTYEMKTPSLHEIFLERVGQ